MIIRVQYTRSYRTENNDTIHVIMIIRYNRTSINSKRELLKRTGGGLDFIFERSATRTRDVQYSFVYGLTSN